MMPMEMGPLTTKSSQILCLTDRAPSQAPSSAWSQASRSEMGRGPQGGNPAMTSEEQESNIHS
jgi:hypothetical protein